jgi:dUTP pyrophosphatase
MSIIKEIKKIVKLAKCETSGYVCVEDVYTDMQKIKIKYFDKEIDKLEYIGGGKSNWIDLRSAETIHLKKGEFRLIPLGVGMKLPDGYEANIVPRSSTYKNFKILQTNSFAVIDNSYSGDTDEWKLPVIAMEDITINKNDRICQFRINKIQPEIKFEEVEHLEKVSRGGIGSTGTN